MNTYIKTLSFLVLLTALVACQRQVDAPLPEHQARLVANAMLVSEEPARIVVSRSFGMDEPYQGESVYLTDATVTLSRDGQAPETLAYDDLGQGGFGYFSSQLTVPGSRYVLRVSHPDYPELRQEMVMPTRPQVTGIEIALGVRLDQFAHRVDEITYDLLDPADTANYYALAVGFWPDSTNPNIPFPLTHYWGPLGLNFLPDPTAELAQGYSVIGDGDFDGQAARIRFESAVFGGSSQYPLTEEELRQGYYVLRLISLNEPAYRYGAELWGHRNSRALAVLTNFGEDQFPITSYSNAEGGFGVFMGQTVRVDTLRW